MALKQLQKFLTTAIKMSIIVLQSIQQYPSTIPYLAQLDPLRLTLHWILISRPSIQLQFNCNYRALALINRVSVNCTVNLVHTEYLVTNPTV